MAEVIWTIPAQAARRKFYLQGVKEFGKFTANKTDAIIDSIERDLEQWPTAGFPELLLKNLPKLYRAKHINKRYTLIYRYEEDIDTVYIEDIWDTKRSPKNLTNRLNRTD
jgi:plasmid maintenance system killer protein